MNYIQKRKPGTNIVDALADQVSKKISLHGDVGWNSLGTLWRPEGDVFAELQSNELSQYYTKVEVVAACVNELANAACEGMLEVGRYNDDGEFEAVENHDVLGLFYENQYMSYSDIVGLTVKRLSLTGAAFGVLGLFKNKRGAGDLVPVPTHAVRQMANGPRVTGYKYGTAGDFIDLDANEVAAVVYRDPQTLNGYISPLSSAMRRCQIDIEQTMLTGQVMKNRDIPGLSMSTENKLSKDQMKALRESINRSVGGDTGGRGKALVLPHGVKVDQQVGVDDIDFSALSALNETRICMVFQVPPILIGAKAGLDNATYSNYEQARKSFYRETVSALWTQLSAAWTRELLQAHGDKEHVIRFNASEVGELQDDLNAAAERAQVLFTAGIIDRNEARSMVGLEADADSESAASEPDPEPEPELDVDGQNDETEEAGKAMYAKAAPAIGGFPEAESLEDAFRKEFRRQRIDALRQFNDEGMVDMTTIGSTFGDDVSNELGAIWANSAREALTNVLGDPERVGSAFSVVNPFLQERIDRQKIQLARSTLETTQKSIDAALARTREALREEMVFGENTVPALTNAVKNVFEEAETYRARRIAVTESSRAINDAKIVAGNRSGVVRGFVPAVSMDACEICQQYDGNNNATGNALYPFTSAEDAAAQVGQYDARTLPPYHPNCRCALRSVTIDDTTPYPPSGTRLEQMGEKQADSLIPTSEIMD